MLIATQPSSAPPAIPVGPPPEPMLVPNASDPDTQVVIEVEDTQVAPPSDETDYGEGDERSYSEDYATGESADANSDDERRMTNGSPVPDGGNAVADNENRPHPLVKAGAAAPLPDGDVAPPIEELAIQFNDDESDEQPLLEAAAAPAVESINGDSDDQTINEAIVAPPTLLGMMRRRSIDASDDDNVRRGTSAAERRATRRDAIIAKSAKAAAAATKSLGAKAVPKVPKAPKAPKASKAASKAPKAASKAPKAAPKAPKAARGNDAGSDLGGPPPAKAVAADADAQPVIAKRAAIEPAEGEPPAKKAAAPNKAAGPPPAKASSAADAQPAIAKRHAIEPAVGEPPAKKAATPSKAVGAPPAKAASDVGAQPDAANDEGATGVDAGGDATIVQADVAPMINAVVPADGTYAKAPTIGNFMLTDNQPMAQCENCGSKVVMARLRILSKKKGTFNCDRCRSVVTKLYRSECGMPKMDGMSTLQINEFYQRAQLCNGTLALTNLVTEICLTKESQQQIYYDNYGKFLPLGVWKTMGYDVVAIETKSRPEDVRCDPVLGDVYRVTTMSTGDRGHAAITVTESMSSKGDGKGATGTVKALTDELAKVKKQQRDATQLDNKKEKAVTSIGKIAMKIRNILAMSQRAFSPSVLESANALLTSSDSIASENPRDIVCDELMGTRITSRAHGACMRCASRR